MSSLIKVGESTSEHMDLDPNPYKIPDYVSTHSLSYDRSSTLVEIDKTQKVFACEYGQISVNLNNQLNLIVEFSDKECEDNAESFVNKKMIFLLPNDDDIRARSGYISLCLKTITNELEKCSDFDGEKIQETIISRLSKIAEYDLEL